MPVKGVEEKVADAAPMTLAVVREAGANEDGVTEAEARAQVGEVLLAGAKAVAALVKVDAAHGRAARVKAVGVVALVCRPARNRRLALLKECPT